MQSTSNTRVGKATGAAKPAKNKPNRMVKPNEKTNGRFSDSRMRASRNLVRILIISLGFLNWNILINSI